MKPYRVDLTDILHAAGAQTTVVDSIELDPIIVGDEVFEPVAPATFEVTFTNAATGIVASGKIHARVTAECSRCLVPFEMPLDGEVEAFFVERGHAEGIPDEQPTEPIEDGSVDLAPALVAALAIETPLAPLHAEDCKGICPICGADRNLEECGCGRETPPSPFDVLRGMFPPEEE